MIRWRLFGRDLKRNRDRLGLGIRGAARQMRQTHATVCRAENAKAINTTAFMAGCAWMEADPMKYWSDTTEPKT